MSDEYINKKDVVDLGVMMQTHLWTREQTYNAIFCLPTADVAPVRHAHWVLLAPIYNSDGLPTFSVKCSRKECGKIAWRRTDYCPNCGAKMDEGEDDE